MTETQEPRGLTVEKLRDAVKSAAAFRLRARLNGVGGESDKVFPPTYAGGVYAVEDRRIDGKVVRCALLDSVQSQANRMEESLLNAFLPSWRELDPQSDNVGNAVPSDLPVLAVHIKNHGWITSLTAPHRIHDAIIRDCAIAETVEGKTRNVRFRESTAGREIVSARIHKATPFFMHCPTALIFGTWDSTAGEGLDSAKVPRAVVSEIIGVDIAPGVRTGSRIDPLGIRANSATIYRQKNARDDWTLDAKTGKEDNKKFGKGKPADINHGNVTPDLPRFDRNEVRKQGLDRLPDILETMPWELRHDVSSGDGRFRNITEFHSDRVRIKEGAVKPGGVTMAYAIHTWTLSLTQLRRLRFPIASQDGERVGPSRDSGDRRNEAARTVLAALALYALALRQEEGYWLRSRCELVSEGPLTLEQVGGRDGSFLLGNPVEMRTILDQAISEAEQTGLEWSRHLTVLTPTSKLLELVRRSDALGPDSDDEEESASADSAS